MLMKDLEPGKLYQLRAKKGKEPFTRCNEGDIVMYLGCRLYNPITRRIYRKEKTYLVRMIIPSGEVLEILMFEGELYPIHLDFYGQSDKVNLSDGTDK